VTPGAHAMAPRVSLAMLLAAVPPLAAQDAAAPPTTRDPWRWPFSADSIWNTPIGSGAVYTPAGLGPATHVGTDIQILLRTAATDPEREVLDSPTWGPGRASGKTPLGFALRVPDDWIVPDAGKDNPYGLTPNANFAILLPDGDSLLQGCKVCRVQRGGPVHMPDWMRFPANRKTVSLRGDGLEGGGQGASGMSALGGTIRLGELVGNAPIRHAVKINPFAARYCFYSKEIPGWRWPAKRADSYAPKEYKGTNPAVVMGSLLALKPDATPEALGLQTAPGRKLFFALQNYGAYFTEDAAWDTWDLIVERDVEKEFVRAHGFTMNSETWRDEVNRLMTALHVVDNNGPSRIGGGGKPRQPPAPPFRTEAAAGTPANLGGGAAAAPAPKAEPPAARTPRPGAAEAWKERLKARLLEQIASGKGPCFAAFGGEATVTAAAPDGNLTVRMTGGGLARVRWEQIGPGEGLALAQGLLREGTAADHALVAFYLILNRRSPAPHLERAGRWAPEVESSFAE